MKFKSNEISFIVNPLKEETLSSYLYRTLPNHSHRETCHINKNTKMVICHCYPKVREQAFKKAKRLGIFDNIIQVQPFSLPNKMHQYIVVKDIDGINIPETKHVLNLNDTISDWIVKPPQGLWGRGVAYATKRKEFNKIYQRKINKVREFRTVQCSWFDDILSGYCNEKFPNVPDILMQNRHGGGARTVPVFYNNEYHEDLLSEELQSNLCIAGAKIIKALNYDYGALDFVIDEHDKLQFIECNSFTNFELDCTETAFIINRDQTFKLYNDLMNNNKEFLYNKLYKTVG